MTAPLNMPLKAKNLTITPSRLRLPRTVEEYLHWKPKNGFKYEWVNGKLLKFQSMITPEQFHIVDNLQRIFAKTKAYAEGDSLMPETISKTSHNKYRVPDIGYYTLSQRREMYGAKPVTPYFAVEIISPSNSADEMFEKLLEYFDNGVQVVWYIYPKNEKVCVYHALEQMKVCQGSDICSAEKVIDSFAIAAKDIFQKP